MMRSRFVITLLIILCSFYSVFACSCLSTSSRNKFCDAEFVILGRVVSTDINEADLINGKTYTVEVLVTFKGPLTAGSIQLINTAIHGATCGVSLQDGGYYLLAGHKINGDLKINLCGWNTLWSNLKSIERKRLWYKTYYCRTFRRPHRGPVEVLPFLPIEPIGPIRPRQRPRQRPRKMRFRLPRSQPSINTINRLNERLLQDLRSRELI